jgi:16S rRNA (uracil1498-N3)-methyltransferase
MSTVHRLFVDAPLGSGLSVVPAPPQAHYLLGVLRLKAGDTVELFNGRDGGWRAELREVTKKSAQLHCTAQSQPQEPVPDLWLLAAPLKKGRIDWLAEKACELGVARLLPVETQRTVVDRLNLDRLHAHMVEAAEQCGRTAVPTLEPLTSLAKLLKAWPAGRRLLFCDESGGAPAFAALIAAGPGPWAILIGPEGGFTDQERALLRALPDVVPVSLGPRILRADTAAAAAISLWQAALGDWRA